MAAFEPTASQRAAIETTGRSILVSAGAGSGKTKVLTERLMRYILDREHPTDIDRFVIITYTRAAAGELRSRITEELISAAAEAVRDPSVPPAFLRHIRRQQALIGKAQIGTIHHFCASVLRENCHLTSLPPDFKILSEERGDAMKETALQKVLEARYAALAEYPGFEDLVNSVGTGRDDSALVDLAYSLYNKMQCHAFPGKWAESILSELSDDVADIGETVWGKEILTRAQNKVDYVSRCMDRLLALAASDEKARVKFLANLSESASGIRELGRCIRAGWEAARNCPDPKFPRLNRKPDPDDENLTNMLKKGRDKCKEDLKTIRTMLASDTASMSAELHAILPSMRALFDLVLDFDSTFAEEKLRAGYSDYSDLEHMTARLLIDDDGSPTEIAKHVAESYTEIMVDEYQDVSRVQDAIFMAVSKNGNNLFLVGDVKQAIYRFRLSDAEIFNEKYRTWGTLTEESAPVGGAYPAKCGGDAEEAPLAVRQTANCDSGTAVEQAALPPVKILLRENFRSRREILDCANSVFRHCMSEQLGDVEYDENASLVFGSTAYGDSAVPVPELMLIRAPENGRDVEAETVAKLIEELIASGTTVTGKNGPRPVEYGDIAILLRSANSVGVHYRKALMERGIPVTTAQGGGYFETREVSLLLSMLKVLDNPHRDAELVALMSSPIYGFTPDELAEIRIRTRDTDLWGAVSAGPAGNEPEALQKKLQGFTDSLRFFRSVAPDMTCDRLIRLIFSETGLPAICSAMPDGEQKEANLNRLIRIAADFEKDGSHGFHRFVQYLIRLSEKNSVVSSGCDKISAVQIISIHRSKGLEYPIVFLCDVAHRFNSKDSSDPVLVHPDLGLGPKIADPVRLVKYPTVARRAITLRLRHETASEELRLLYVAMTRPRERLFITASCKDPEKEMEQRMAGVETGGGRIEPELLACASGYLDWLLAAATADGEKHIQIKIVEPENEKETEAVALQAEGEEGPAGMETAEVIGKDAVDNTHAADVTHAAEVMDAVDDTDAADRPYKQEVPEDIDPGYIEELNSRLNYIYPYEDASMLPSKVTATELKHGEQGQDEESTPLAASPVEVRDETEKCENAGYNPGESEETEEQSMKRYYRKPDFTSSDRALSPTERGIATHLTLQHMDLRKGADAEGVRAETQRLLEMGFLSEKQAQSVNVGSIVRLFTSPLGQRILNAPVLHREFRFSLLCDAAELFGKAPGEKILLQGVVDCCLEEEDGLVIVDYKTDNVRTEEQLRARREYYSGQIRAYAMAMSRIFGKPVKETVLYFLAAGKPV